MVRPFWSGQIRISLVSFGVKLFPATDAKSEIHFHQLSRKTGERVHHQKVAGDDGEVANEDIVKGYEYKKGEYVSIEPEEIAHLRIPSQGTINVTQFAGIGDIAPSFFEKPYFVVPEDDQQAEAFTVVRKALQSMEKVALGKIAFGGREHLVAIAAPHDDKLAGMMAYTMRYDEELRDPAEYFNDIKKVEIDQDQLSLAKELIKRHASKFKPEQFKDEYESALRELVKAKLANEPIPKEEPAPKSGKVISLMDALRRSVKGDDASSAATAKTASRGQATSAKKHGMTLVKNKKSASSRKTA
jgi:DNA end-binding protein Ku